MPRSKTRRRSKRRHAAALAPIARRERRAFAAPTAAGAAAATECGAIDHDDDDEATIRWPRFYGANYRGGDATTLWGPVFMGWGRHHARRRSCGCRFSHRESLSPRL